MLTSFAGNSKDKYYSHPPMRNLRKLLFPFALLYGLITGWRNFLYNSQILKSKSYDIPVICVGNLNTGGTGKSPMIEYLIKLLKEDYRVASLSRGYKRKTKGYHLLKGNETGSEVGDEPLQFKKKFPEALIAVDENRQKGIEALVRKKAEVILLDDAFQHRKVTAGLNVMLTAYADLYVDDFLLPAGNLREPYSGAARAKIIFVTKCPENLTKTEQERIRKKLELRNYQQLYFSFIRYSDEIFSSITKQNLETLRNEKFTLVTGIANPKPLTTFLKKKQLNFIHKSFPDHHNFTQAEIEGLKKENLILTTEKDFMRLCERLPQEKLFYLPIEVGFINNEEDFLQAIKAFLNKK